MVRIRDERGSGNISHNPGEVTEFKPRKSIYLWGIVGGRLPRRIDGDVNVGVGDGGGGLPCLHCLLNLLHLLLDTQRLLLILIFVSSCLLLIPHSTTISYKHLLKMIREILITHQHKRNSPSGGCYSRLQRPDSMNKTVPD